MEKPITDLALFENYRNRQVILNYYEEDIMSKRYGFDFLSIIVSNDELSFTKKDSGVLIIQVKKFSNRTKNDEFQDYYIFRNPDQDEALEIYFI